MNLLCSFVVLLSLAAQSTSHAKLRVAVYYESKCPDSKRFILDQLVPTVHKLGDYLHLQLIPFGKAWRGNGKFNCQHGDSECLGNIMQDCAISLMTSRPDAAVLKYVACEMQTLSGTFGDPQCVRHANLPEQTVLKCVNSRQGMDLQFKSLHLTQNVNPTYIPTITVNGRFVKQIQDESQRNLFGTLCSLIPDAEPCKKRYHRSLF